MLPVEKKPDGILISVYVQPKSSGNQVAGMHQDALKVRVTAPPADHKANRMCIKFLAKELQVPQSSIQLVSGKSSRSKKLFIGYTDKKDKKIQEKQLIERLSALIK